jgi:hypothetical protein
MSAAPSFAIRLRVLVIGAAVMALTPACAQVLDDLPPCRPAQIAESGGALDITCWIAEHVDVVALGAQPALGPYASTNFLAVIDRFGPGARELDFSSGALSHTADGYTAALSSRGVVQGHRVLGVRVQPPASGAAMAVGPLDRILRKLAADHPDAARATFTVMSTLAAEQGGMLRFELEQWRIIGVDWSQRLN